MPPKVEVRWCLDRFRAESHVLLSAVVCSVSETPSGRSEMTNAERFMQSYLEVWPSFDADRLEQTVDPETTIHHSGMPRPIRGAEEPDYVRAIKALMPDIGLEVVNWAGNDEVVFV